MTIPGPDPQREARARRAQRLLGRGAVALFVIAGVLVVYDVALDTDELPDWPAFTAYFLAFIFVWIGGAHEDDQVRPFDQRRAGATLGLAYVSADSAGIEDLPASVIPAPPGRDPFRVANVLRGARGDHLVVVFDSMARQEKAWWDDDEMTFSYLSAAARVETQLPPLVIEPRGEFGRRRRSGGAYAVPDSEFHRRFAVECVYPELALPFLTTEIQTWCLTRRLGVRMDRHWVLVYRERIGLTDVEALLRDLDDLLARLPLARLGTEAT